MTDIVEFLFFFLKKCTMFLEGEEIIIMSCDTLLNKMLEDLDTLDVQIAMLALQKSLLCSKL